jgi:ParB family chromosome partitioning protein
VRNFGRVDIDLVEPDPDQPRLEFSEEAIERLAQSIRDKGQLTPIRVRWSAELEKWVIISGERRWRATRRAGLPVIECYFHEGDLNRSEILEQQLIENLLREDLSPIEEAKAYRSLIELNSWTGKQVADALRIPPSKVSRNLALLQLPTDLQHGIESGQLAASTAYELTKLANDDVRRELAQRAMAGKLVGNKALSEVRKRRGKAKAAPCGGPAAARPEASGRPASRSPPVGRDETARGPADARTARRSDASPRPPRAAQRSAVPSPWRSWKANLASTPRAPRGTAAAEQPPLAA